MCLVRRLPVPYRRLGAWKLGESGSYVAQHVGPQLNRYEYDQVKAGGRTTLALFEAGEGHPMIPQQTGVAFVSTRYWPRRY